MAHFEFGQGNQWWRQRSKHGRDTLFATPQLLLEAAMEYFVNTDGRKWYKREAIKSGLQAGQVIEIEMDTPYTWSGLCLYLQCGQEYFRSFRKNKERCTPDFLRVIAVIDEIIETQLLEGASVGSFNANIISRKLGLADKLETKNTTIIVEQPDAKEDDDDE